MKAVIFDIDGTLADCTHRLHLKDSEGWHAFFREMHNDSPIEPVFAIMRAMHMDNYSILLVTARPEQYREATDIWLGEHNAPFDAFYMRQDDDTRKDSEVKKDILQKILDDGYEPFLVIDDRPQVVEMWRDMGIFTLACPWVEKSPYEGEALLYIMVGPSGAGKSTYIQKNFKPHEVVSTDQIRQEMFGSFGKDVQTPQHHARVFKYAHSLIRTRLESGLRTVFDATNLRRKDRMAVLAHVPKGQLANYVLIDREYNEKLRTRDWRPEELVKRHHQTFVSTVKDVLRGDDQPNVVVYDRREHKV